MREKLNAISESVIGAAIAVHRELGPGLLESAYESCLEFELLDRGFAVERQKALPVISRGLSVECGFRIDLRVNGLVIVELKAVEKLERIHEAQVNTYLRLTGLHLGLLMNFNVTRLTDGIKRVVRDFPNGSDTEQAS
jgi:GxxExxY protein